MLVVLILYTEEGSVRLGYSRNPYRCCCCVCFKGWLRVYYGLDLLLSKLSIAQSSRKFRERHTGVGVQRVLGQLSMGLLVLERAGVLGGAGDLSSGPILSGMSRTPISFFYKIWP